MIEVQALTKIFGDPKSDKAVRAVDDVTFAVKAGEIFAFLGPQRRRQDDDDPDADDAARDRRAAACASTASIPRRARSRSASASASCSRTRASTASSRLTRTWTCTACSITCRAKLRTERIEALMKLFELWDRRTSLVKTFSGGMRRRLEIARGLLAHAEDPVPRRADARPRSAEPQSALDAREELERERRSHGVPDDALHGRGREGGTTRRDHRSRPHRRAGQRAGAAKRKRAPIRWKTRS